MSEQSPNVSFKHLIIFIIAASISLFIGVYTYDKPNKVSFEAIPNHAVITQSLNFGFDFQSFNIDSGTIHKDQFLADILIKHKVGYNKIQELADECRDIFDVRRLRSGRDYIILNQDTSTAADYFIYRPNSIDYVVYDLKNPCASLGQLDVDIEINKKSGIIETSLWKAMEDAGLPWQMISKMEDALAWSVDFYHIQKNDRFKLVYESKKIGDETVGIGRLLGAEFESGSKTFNAIFFDDEEWGGYYDLEARPMKKAFLKSPVEYGRISSKYNLRRRHPVLKRVKPHLGTDYAAPLGTPIRSVAKGTVTHVAFTRGNGNYVKVKHDKTFTTQYLHMSRFAQGIKPGTKVSQGEVIGYVGKTGLATGYHVCFRFWKNGKQVDHLKEELPKPEPMPDHLKEEYYINRDSIKLMLDEISYPVIEEKISS